ncbi:tyrosine-type recombinase/integrase [Brevundimonas sp. R86498]|uniref:site-specific integrase n=1 Tax=Brevundimonas sp. R86498 TaxID=3093845 RepID=UPI0037C81E99
MAKAASVDTVPVLVMTFADLFRHFQADPAKVRASKTRMIYDGLLWITSGVWGENRPLRSIDRLACRELLEVLRWLPSNPGKRFPSLNAVQAAKMAKKHGLTSTLSPGSINGYMAKLRALMTFAVNEGWIDRNPATGLSVVDPVRDKDKRLPFSPEQLRLIFNAPIYRGCADDGWRFATPGPNRPRRARFWIPLIALYSGMRLNEICQLDVADIRSVQGHDCFWITGGATQNSGDKRLKTASSERLIPIHPTLIAMGFMGFVSERSGSKKLFNELPRSKAGYYSDSYSKWFARFLAKAGATRPRTCFHSFRHCYRDALRNAGVAHEVAMALGGWAAASRESENVSAAYGRGHGVSRLAEAIARLEYECVDLRYLLPDLST